MKETFVEQLQALTRRETKLREELEGKIFSLVGAFYLEVGAILAEINERRLYKSTHYTFGEYCSEVLDMARSRAYQYVAAHEVAINLLPEDMKNVHNCGQNISQLIEIIRHEISKPVVSGARPPLIPLNESQARALVGLEPDEQRRVWGEAVETAPDGKITAAHIRRTARALGLAKLEKKIEKAKRARSANKARMSAEFEEAFNIFLSAVQKEAESGWKGTDRATVCRYLDGIRSGIGEYGAHSIPERGYALELANYEKLHQAGLEIFRLDKIKMIIEQRHANGDWYIVHKSDDADELDRVFLKILEDPKNIRG